MNQLEKIMKTLRDKEADTDDPILKKRRKMRNDLTEILMAALLVESLNPESDFGELMDRITWAFAVSWLSVLTTTLHGSRDPEEIAGYVDILCKEIARHAMDSVLDPSVKWHGASLKPTH